ncbi:hypothetical protein ACFYWY_27620 [Streptomyces sp. NPDC002870]
MFDSHGGNVDTCHCGYFLSWNGAIPQGFFESLALRTSSVIESYKNTSL